MCCHLYTGEVILSSCKQDCRNKSATQPITAGSLTMVLVA